MVADSVGEALGEMGAAVLGEGVGVVVGLPVAGALTDDVALGSATPAELGSPFRAPISNRKATPPPTQAAILPRLPGPRPVGRPASALRRALLSGTGLMCEVHSRPSHQRRTSVLEPSKYQPAGCGAKGAESVVWVIPGMQPSPPGRAERVGPKVASLNGVSGQSPAT